MNAEETRTALETAAKRALGWPIGQPLPHVAVTDHTLSDMCAGIGLDPDATIDIAGQLVGSLPPEARGPSMAVALIFLCTGAQLPNDGKAHD